MSEVGIKTSAASKGARSEHDKATHEDGEGEEDQIESPHSPDLSDSLKSVQNDLNCLYRSLAPILSRRGKPLPPVTRSSLTLGEMSVVLLGLWFSVNDNSEVKETIRDQSEGEDRGSNVDDEGCVYTSQPNAFTSHRNSIRSLFHRVAQLNNKEGERAASRGEMDKARLYFARALRNVYLPHTRTKVCFHELHSIFDAV
eukprot:GHVN01018415.1.p1 GENE.GHVN01018415.1~~GHVN01018415.1.p1  ORF type:complete len:199 (-),score=60.22 GHVN01018415.1:251-847(-)